MCIPTADFRIGDANPGVLLVGACPGQDEEENGRPFVGQAGQNLAVMLQRLHFLRPDIFPSERLDDYSLINAHSLPRYRGRDGYDGRTQPLKREVLADENRARFAAQVEQLQPTTIVYLGKAAEFAHEIVEATAEELQAYRTGHPSTQAWNTRPDYVGIQAEEKLLRWADDRLELMI
jgi:uracil-DNA glycosylase